MTERSPSRQSDSQPHARRSNDHGRSRKIAPDNPPTDRRRLAAAAFSSILPGSGQIINGRWRPAVFFGVPTAVRFAVAWWIAHADRPTMILARIIAPSALGLLLVLNVVLLAWRAIATLHA